MDSVSEDDLISQGQPGPRLTVPKVLVLTDKTPTPTKLLQAVDEIGLFQDEDDDDLDRKKKVFELKDRLSGQNPFDEHFRKATLKQKDGIFAEANSSKKDDEVLNTPQIITSEYPTPAVLLTSEIFTSKTQRSTSLVTPTRPANRPIAPALTPPAPGVQQAQLLLRLPGGETVQLSNLPFVQAPAEKESKKKIILTSEASKKSVKKPKGTTSSDDDSKKQMLLERNRAAAFRSRVKKRVHVETVKEQNAKLLAINKAQSQEIGRLKAENSQLRSELVQHTNCSQGQKNSLHVQSQQVQIIPVNPQELVHLHQDQVDKQVILVGGPSQPAKESKVTFGPTGMILSNSSQTFVRLRPDIFPLIQPYVKTLDKSHSSHSEENLL